MTSNTYLLVMTACIDPAAGSYKLQRADPMVRLGDYEEALRFWLHYRDPRIDKILVIENSGYSLASLKKIVDRDNPLNKSVEFVGLNCNFYPATTHYGYAEMHMLDIGLQQSALRKTVSHIVKVTGRLKFHNLSALLDRVPEDVAVVSDARVWRTPFTRHKSPFVATQLVLFSYPFYQRHLEGTYGELEASGLWMESLYFKKIVAAQHATSEKSRIVMRFPCNVDPVGQPAHRPSSYTGWRQRAVNGMRALLRRVAPGWWI